MITSLSIEKISSILFVNNEALERVANIPCTVQLTNCDVEIPKVFFPKQFKTRTFESNYFTSWVVSTMIQITSYTS
jgi:hypothetical protein